MAFPLTAFPFATPYDPSEDPPTSVDPLGTVSQAERLAEVLLPGMTARMWRARLLTFSAVAALVADRVVDLKGRDDVRMDARLAFERLYVAALVRRENDDGMARAIRRVTGTDRARLALRAGEPLTRANFLKGQSINGPTGVMARLARQLGIVDEEGLLGPRSLDLLVAWSADVGMPGVLAEGRRDASEGAKLISRLADTTVEVLEGRWPGNQAGIWTDLVHYLRPDSTGKTERKKLIQLLWSDPTGIRGRVLDLLKHCNALWYEQRENGRAVAERAVLREGIKPLLGQEGEDLLIRAVLEGTDAFEQASCAVQATFDTLRWCISGCGAASAKTVLADARVAKSLERIRKRLPTVVNAMDSALTKMDAEPSFLPVALDPVRQLRDDLGRGAPSAEALVDAVLDRHDRVQRDKRKGRWIERGERLTLMPGFGFDGDGPPYYDGIYLHPLRVANVYVMLGDLGVVRGGQDVETQTA